MWKMLEKTGVKRRLWGSLAARLNPVIDARFDGNIDSVHLRHEEYGVFAAVADAYFSGNPVVVCGTAEPGVTSVAQFASGLGT